MLSTYKDFIREQGAPSILCRDNAKEQDSEALTDLHRQLLIKDEYSEVEHQHQNPVEGCAISWLKGAVHRLMDRVGAPDTMWFAAMHYLVDVWNHTWHPTLKMTPHQKRHGTCPDISAFLQFSFWEPILYLDHEKSWSSSRERAGRWLGVAHNIGDTLTYFILDDQSKKILVRSVMRPLTKNVKVHWNPEFAKYDALATKTAHHGGYPSFVQGKTRKTHYD